MRRRLLAAAIALATPLIVTDVEAGTIGSGQDGVSGYVSQIFATSTRARLIGANFYTPATDEILTGFYLYGALAKLQDSSATIKVAVYDVQRRYRGRDQSRRTKCQRNEHLGGLAKRDRALGAVDCRQEIHTCDVGAEQAGQPVLRWWRHWRSPTGREEGAQLALVHVEHPAKALCILCSHCCGSRPGSSTGSCTSTSSGA